MLEDQVAYLLQRYLGNYVRGLNKEALKISVWQGDVELTNMQLKPEALNALKLPVRVKAGFLGSVKLKVPWSRLGQDPVLVYLDRIFILAEPATVVEGSSEDAVQEVKKSRIREMEMKLLESRHMLKSEMNKSWLGSLIGTVIGNLKLSISNIHIRYEDLESNPQHPFAAGVTLDKLSAFTVDDQGEETFVTGGALERTQKSVELERMAIYLDSDIKPWYILKRWEDLQPSEWEQIFKFGTRNGKPEVGTSESHTCVLQPVCGSAKYLKDLQDDSSKRRQPLHQAAVNLDDVTLCLSKNGYRDLLKLADNFTAFNLRVKYAHYRPRVSVNADPISWWKYAFSAVTDQMKKTSGKLSWEQVLRYTRLRKKYISLYASLLKSDNERAVIDDNNEIDEIDLELDAEVVLQWRMMAHKFVEQSVESESFLRKQKSKKSWWLFGWTYQPDKEETDSGILNKEDWKRLNDIIGYKGDEQILVHERGGIPNILLNLSMRHNASKLIDSDVCLADLSCDNLECHINFFSETKVVDIKLGSYRLLSPNGLLAESESPSDSLVGVFSFKPHDVDVDWSVVAKASPCYVTYLKDSVNQIIDFFQSSASVSQTLVQETASAVQMTINGVKRTAAKQVNRVLKERTRFLLDLDIAAPKITIPTEFFPDSVHSTKLLIDFGRLAISSQNDAECASPEEMNLYTQFNLILRDVSAFLVDGEYSWNQNSLIRDHDLSKRIYRNILPVIDKCGVFLKLQQIRFPTANLPSTRIAMRLPSMGFYFSPSRYHRLLQVVSIFQAGDAGQGYLVRPWDEPDFADWVYHLTRKGVGGREAVWQHSYFCIVGPTLYMLENPMARSYKQYVSLRGKQLYQVPVDFIGNVDNVFAVFDAERAIGKVLEDANALILHCDSENSRKTWQIHIQRAIYRASGTAPVAGPDESLSDSEDSETDNRVPADLLKSENLFLTGVLDELKICLSYSGFPDQSFSKLLLAEEKNLLEFRAIGGQIELSIRENDVFIGTVVKALEIEDMFFPRDPSQIYYLARSFIKAAYTPSLFDINNSGLNQIISEFSQNEGDEEFYEASENLNDSTSSTMSPTHEIQSGNSNLKGPIFTRSASLLPSNIIHLEDDELHIDDTESFVKSQIIMLDHNSPLYSNVDKKVAITVSMLSFYCRRPTILAIMEFVNAINFQEDSHELFSDASSSAAGTHSVSKAVENDGLSSTQAVEPIVKSLLGKGKSRVIFGLQLYMSRAEISLMTENELKLATLAQDNFLADIKVFPSSFSIKASLGNLKISDDSLHTDHMYFWACDMRNPGGKSFVEIVFCSFSTDDEDYEGFDYSLVGQLSEVRIVYLNRFLQEVISYFMGLAPRNSKEVLQIKDYVANSDKLLTRSEIEGSPAVKLDVLLKNPIILMPKMSNSVDYLKLDVVQITVQNTFRWIGGIKTEIKAVRMEIMKIVVDDIKLNVGSGSELSESIIQDVKGVSFLMQRSLRDLLHQFPDIEVAIMVDGLKAALSNKEYEIIIDCAQKNISETPNIMPPLKDESSAPLFDVVGRISKRDVDIGEFESGGSKIWITTKISVRIDMLELRLYYGNSRDVSLSTLQMNGLWILYKFNTVGEGFLSSTLKDLIVVDDREGTEEELRLAIGKIDLDDYNSSKTLPRNSDSDFKRNYYIGSARMFCPAVLIFDANFYEHSMSLSLCIQRPRMLVTLDFLLAIAEFFVPAIRAESLNDENANSSHFLDPIILDMPIFFQPSSEYSISPQKPLVVDDERFEHFTYDGRGGILYLKDRQGADLCCPSMEALIYIGNGKKLQFRNVKVKGGQHMDSSILLGVNSSYLANVNDNVILDGEFESPHLQSSERNISMASQAAAPSLSKELIFELQAIGPELTFYNKSKNAGQLLSNKLLHAQMDAFCRLVFNEGTIEMRTEIHGLTMESNGIKILEPFDAGVELSSTLRKTIIHLKVSDIFMNFSFSILRLFLDVEDDILSFLSARSKKPTVLCLEFDQIGIIKSQSGQVYAFWRPRAPTGFAVLGDYLTPIDKAPTKGVIAVNTRLLRVKRPKSFTLVWSTSSKNALLTETPTDSAKDSSRKNRVCSIWFPESPNGYLALGCVASSGMAPPPISSVFCILASLVSPCGLRDCISMDISSESSNLAFWRVDNAIGSFLPTEPETLNLTQRAFELRHFYLDFWRQSSENLQSLNGVTASVGNDTIQSERSSLVNSRRRFEAVATFRLIWWNQGSGSRKKISIWRPVVAEGMVYFGDIAVQGYEPPNSCVVLQDSENHDLYKDPSNYLLVCSVKKQRRMESVSFWMPEAPPGFVTLGCVACKGTPSQSDFSSLRCIRSDMVSTDQFSDGSIWDSSELMFSREQFSIWTVSNELGTFIAWKGLKKPPGRLALALSGPDIPSASDSTLIDAEIRTFSVALFDDYGGLMIPLCNLSVSDIGFSLHGIPDCLHSSVNFSLALRSYNDKYDSWEPLVEPIDGLLRYQYNPSGHSAASQIRVTSTNDLNLNVSVSNINMVLQAYGSWSNVSYTQVSNSKATGGSSSMVDVHQKRNYYIVPQNKLGMDIFIRAFEERELSQVIKMPAGDIKALEVPILRNMLDSHLKGNVHKQQRVIMTVIVAEAELPKQQGLSSCQYSVGLRILEDNYHSVQPQISQQRARTSGVGPAGCESSNIESVKWNEVFFFRVDSVDSCILEFNLNDSMRGEPVGYYASSMEKLVALEEESSTQDCISKFAWLELASKESVANSNCVIVGKIKCAVLIPPRLTTGKSVDRQTKTGLIQISPTQKGPWTTLRLNYGAPAACWQIGNDVVASEVTVIDGNRYVSIRSLVSVRNSTDYAIDLCLRRKDSDGSAQELNAESREAPDDKDEFATDELFESEVFDTDGGWVPSTDFRTLSSGVDLNSGWTWIDEWHVDKFTVDGADGWIYGEDFQSLKWPQSCDSLMNKHVRQRRWIRNRKRASDHYGFQIIIGALKPGESVPLPLPCLSQPSYALYLRPSDVEATNQYTWSTVVNVSAQSQHAERSREILEVCVSTLRESEKLLYCSESGSSSNISQGLWFCLDIQATEISKDSHSNLIQDWTISVKPPVTIANYLPFMAEISLLEIQNSGHFSSCYRGVFVPGESVKVYTGDIRNPLYLSLLPQGGWLALHEAVLISHPTNLPSKTISLRSSVSGRIVQIILEQNHTLERPIHPRLIKVYSPYWISVARCPPLSFRLFPVGTMSPTKNLISFKSRRLREIVFEEITEEEIYEGYTMASALHFKSLRLSASIGDSGGQEFGPPTDLSPLGDMDGALDLFAHNSEGNCMQLYVSSKPCPYQSIPTKVISVRPFMNFTNRVGQIMLLKLSREDAPKTLRVSDTRVSFMHPKTDGPNNIQVRMLDTDWSFPIQILKEDTITLSLKKHDGKRRFLRTEIRGYEEGSRFIVVFRLRSFKAPIRLENRTKTISVRFRQTGFDEDAWISLPPLSTSNFSWEDPYGQKVIDAEIDTGSIISLCKFDLNKTGFFLVDNYPGLSLHVVNIGDLKAVRFLELSAYSREEASLYPLLLRNWGKSNIQANLSEQRSPLELILELGGVGISVVDHRPRELIYLYMEKLFISYSTGYDGGTTSRFKLIVGYMQLDNQLPLTVMPVLLAPDQIPDVIHPVFKMTITARNDTLDGLEIYPYIYITVIDKVWRLNVHEPIIWALLDFFHNLRFDRVAQNSSTSQVDPEIRVDLIDISGVRFKVSLEAEPYQRPHGLLGVWGPVLSAVGNAFKFQVHLRKVTHKDRFLRKSSVYSVIETRIWRDLIHNPLHLISSIDVLGMTSSTLASLSKGFAELSTDGQFLQLRSKQVWSRRITGIGDGIVQGTEALAQGVAFGVSGVVRKPVQRARQDGLLGLAHGLGQAFLGFFVQPMSGALDFFSLTVDGIGASCSRCLEILTDKKNFERTRIPRAIRADKILREYSEREALGQMILYLAETSRNFGCTEIFKEPSKFAWSDCYEEHFVVPYQRIVLVTNKRLMLLQCVASGQMAKKPCKIMWNVPWEEVMALELAKAGHAVSSHIIIHLKSFKRGESFVRVIKCNTEQLPEEREPQALKVCSMVRKVLMAHRHEMQEDPSKQKQLSFSRSGRDVRDFQRQYGTVIRSTEISSRGIVSDRRNFVQHCINFSRIWSSERESKGRCTLCRKQSVESDEYCSIWRPVCPDGYVCIGDIARPNNHPPTVASIYRQTDDLFTLPVGYDLVWRNCLDDYKSPVSIWHPRARRGYVSLGFIAVAKFEEPEMGSVYCVAESVVEDTRFEEDKIWTAPDSYPWACHLYQTCSDALHLVAVRQPYQELNWRPKRLVDSHQVPLS